MTTFKTGNPVGSTAVKDLYDNAENLDVLVNDRTKRQHEDRLGVPRKTWYGMEQDFQDFLVNSGYQQIGDYGPGLEITARNQVFWKDGELYRAGASLELPYTTTGVWDGEGGESELFVAVGDQVLRQQLESPSGASLVTYGSEIPGSTPISIADFLDDFTPITMFAKGDGTDETAALQAAMNSPIMAFDGLGKTYRTSQINCKSGLRLKNFFFEKIPSAVDQVNVLNWESTDPDNPIRDVYLENVHIDGKRAEETNVGVMPGENGGRSGFRFRGFVENVHMVRCSANYCGTDGLIIFVGGLARPSSPLAVKNFTVEDCVFNWNRRHGISGDSLKNVRFIRTVANGNGRSIPGTTWGVWDGGHGDWVGSEQSPVLYGNGCDIESYGLNNHSEDLYFIDCEMRYNTRGGLLILEVNPVNNPGLTRWSNVVVDGGIYDQGLESVDNSCVYIGVNGTDTQPRIPDTHFIGVYVNIYPASGNVVVRRVDGLLRLVRSRDPSTSLSVASILSRSRITLELNDKDRFHDDGSGGSVWVSRFVRERPTSLVTAPAILPTAVSGDLTLSGIGSSILFNAVKYRRYQLYANLTFGNTDNPAEIDVDFGSFTELYIDQVLVVTRTGLEKRGEAMLLTQTANTLRLRLQPIGGTVSRILITLTAKG